MTSTTVLAVDGGATSVRVCAVDLDRAPLRPVVVHRVEHEPVRLPDGSLRWDWPRIVGAVTDGLAAALERGPAASIGIDTWGVDYGLLGSDGRLLSWPHSYRSDRTAHWQDTARAIGADRLYRTAGIQLMPFNTVFQLAVHDREELARAERLLLLPELLAHGLTGTAAGEVTSAGTTGLVDVATGTWSDDLVGAVGAPGALFPDLDRAGRCLGTWRGIPVHLVAGHDTASAVAALPLVPGDGAAFVATGTWFLVGALRESPDLSPAAQAANFTNEPGALGGVRFLKNVTGLWLLERCREAWGRPDSATLVAEAEACHPGPVVDPDDPELAGAADLEPVLRRLAGLERASRGAVVRCILDSLAQATARTLAELARLQGVALREVHVIGGGTRIPLLPRLLHEATGLPVVTGSAEATAAGNAAVQGVALGRFPDLAAASAVPTLRPWR